MEPVPDLTSSLRSLEALRSVTPVTPMIPPGLRSWWEGALDVEGLALGSVLAAATALEALTGCAARYSASSGPVAASFDSLTHLRIAGTKPQGFAPASGFRRTSDGWIRLHANYPHHAARLMEAMGANSAQDVDDALLTMTSLDAEDAINANRGVATAVRRRGEWASSAMHRALSDEPWIRFLPSTALQMSSTTSPVSSASAAWKPSKDPERPLTGLRVLDLTRVIAGPTATRLLGALGADVLRIDPPGLPELEEAFVDGGFDKRSAVADLGNAAGLETVKDLISTADVVVTGYRNGGLDRFGLGAETLLAGKPDLVVATLSAWGSAGPWRQRRGFDSLVQAACGIAEEYGHLDDDGWKPGALPVQALDHATGYGVAAAVLALLAERLRTGAGGMAALSLARTAEELFRLPARQADVKAARLPQPAYRETPSAYGQLRFVGPPLLVDGVQLQYRRPPVRYGTSPVAWSQ
ncbi:acyl-CoA thioesterase [Paenarthrobacter nicotinovorans]|uniref:CoA transferase n=1 Tax=Paenarthrobacter nicotinovorans TaxID=29320 RepID=UPI0007CCF1F8|nr:CoA transferase [Paenarthrobacter nicotinovorans]GAT86711.1 acyl-CoA thioesterase [Paenarthrobacter nicotinovorans]